MPADQKIRVAIVFGGQSAEHEISILSARNVLAALDRSRFEPVLIGIDKAGHWLSAGCDSGCLPARAIRGWCASKTARRPRCHRR